MMVFFSRTWRTFNFSVFACCLDFVSLVIAAMNDPLPISPNQRHVYLTNPSSRKSCMLEYNPQALLTTDLDPNNTQQLSVINFWKLSFFCHRTHLLGYYRSASSLNGFNLLIIICRGNEESSVIFGCSMRGHLCLLLLGGQCFCRTSETSTSDISRYRVQRKLCVTVISRPRWMARCRHCSIGYWLGKSTLNSKFLYCRKLTYCLSEVKSNTVLM